MLYLIYYKTDYIDYIFKGIDAHLPIRLVELNAACSLFQRFNRRYLPRQFPILTSFVLGKEIRNGLKALTSDDAVLFIGYSEFHLLSSVLKLTPTLRKRFFWNWNPVCEDRKGRRLFNRVRNCGFTPYTFEPRDSAVFNVGLLNQFYRMKPGSRSPARYKFDFYFVGFVKNRGPIIARLQKFLTENGFSVLFHVVDDIGQSISYQQNLENICASRCLVELVGDDLQGITLRALEALAFNRKLLTNNKHIVCYDFYHENNVCIYDDKEIDLRSFLNKRNVKIQEAVINSYDVNTWIKAFLAQL